MRSVLVLCVVAVLTASMASAAAAPEPVQLSNNGRTWNPDLARPLFDPAVRWVPGDGRQASFWVRNAGPSAGALTLTAHVRDADGLRAERAIDLRVRADGGAWTQVTPESRQSLGRLAEGARRQLTVAAVFHGASGNDTMDRSLRFGFDVRLSGDETHASGPGTEPPSGGTPSAPGSHDHWPGWLLPNTGNPVTWWLCLLAAMSLGAGIALVVRSKRRESP